METIERFRWCGREMKAGFGSAVLGGEDWKGNLTLALLVAATAGEGVTNQTEREDAASALMDYLVSSEGQCPFLSRRK